MPFTFSHAAVVLPFFKNKKISASALIVGTFSPDLEYFFRMKMQSEISHSLLGIFILDLPLGLFILFLFHLAIKKPLLLNLPVFFQARTQVLLHSDWNLYFKKNLFWVLVSFIIGSMTHLLWDSMTHWDGYIVQRIDPFNIVYSDIPIYSYAQHFSSVLGMICVIYYFYKLPIQKYKESEIKLSYWFWVLFVSVVVFTVRFSFGIQKGDWATLLVSLISSVVIALAISGLVFTKFKLNRIT